MVVGSTTKTVDIFTMDPNAAWFKAKRGDSDAQYMLAQCYLHGIQQEKSVKQAMGYFGKAAALGHIEAQFHYGLQFLNCKNGALCRSESPQKIAQALFWLQKAAMSGHAEAMYCVGIMSLEGLGTPASDQIAVDWFMKSANLGFKESQFRYATFLERGEPIDKSLGKALAYYVKAGEQDHPEAQHRAALLFSQGVGPPEERRPAWHTLPSVATWAKSTAHAIRLGQARPWRALPSVVAWLGRHAQRPVDWASAAAWHRRAARNGFVPFAYAYAAQLQEGLGKPADPARALVLFREAAMGHAPDDPGALSQVCTR
jgi:hypothetical protein